MLAAITLRWLRFNDGHSQRAVYDRVGAPLVRSCLLGYDTTLFVYGQTGTTPAPAVRVATTAARSHVQCTLALPELVGAAGSGKTYTVFGPPGCYSYGRVGLGDVPMYPDWGLLPRIVDGILRWARVQHVGGGCSRCRLTRVRCVWCAVHSVSTQPS